MGRTFKYKQEAMLGTGERAVPSFPSEDRNEPLSVFGLYWIKLAWDMQMGIPGSVWFRSG